jgi:glycosyltransferase involved in cell wall biosynthesis
VRVHAVAPRMELYTGGRRRIAPPLVFGVGVLAHLIRRRRSYDVVHTASFPYFSLLAAGALRPLCGYDLVVDWHEVWSREYWRGYLGRIGGAIGHLVQRICVRLPQRAFCFSRLHRDRLLASGLRGEATVLEGEYAGDLTPPEPNAAEPLVVFAGRHIPEKRAPAVVPAVAQARAELPELRAEVYGDGPERDKVLEAIARERLDGVVSAPGFVGADEIARALRRSLCMVLPSEREGYGLIVVEASAHGTPSVVVPAPDNAATELVDDGENGVIAESAAPEHLAAAILRVHREGLALRERTCAWFARNASRLSLDASLEHVVRMYSGRD